MKNFPTPYTVLMIVITISVGLTYLLPSGSYDTLKYDPAQDVFLVTTKDKQYNDSTYTVAASEKFLSDKAITIKLEKFREGKIKKPISIPDTYKETPSKKQGFAEIIKAPIEGIYDSIDIMLFILVIGGFIGVLNSSGTLNEGVGFLATKLKGRESILIVMITTLIALGGTTFGLSEETLPFYPILVPVFLAAGYDLIVPVAVILVGSCIGSMASTMNPFSTIIGSDSAGISWTDGIWSRVVMLFVGLCACLWYILRYAAKVKADPTKSIAYGNALPDYLKNSKPMAVSSLKLSSKLQLTIFALTFVVMVVGVSQLDWWFEEMSALFLVSSILIAVMQKTGEKQFISSFMEGAKDLLGVTFIVGMAKGVSLVLRDGQISDTIVYMSVNIVRDMSPVLFLTILMCIYSLMAIFLYTTSGLAVLTMPIVSALGNSVGIEGEHLVNAYMFGMGFMSFLTPTGIVLPSLSLVNVNYGQWLKFIVPLIGITVVIAWSVTMGNYYLAGN